ncbi:MAG: 23S rRNA (uracil(1939)-C(5))-methyltransferase RlmD [Candidatus Gastranaerophilales bacterium]|nr:23S rRNA (uracil(1939)-C(5))-methyltransferase RlmD [Candidatus Gastranaerophilales bacterium]
MNRDRESRQGRGRQQDREGRQGRGRQQDRESRQDRGKQQDREERQGSRKRQSVRRDEVVGRAAEKKTGICPVAGKCGGCRWINRTYEEQLREKERRFAKLIAPFCKAEPIIGMEHPAHYRNKVHAVFGEDRKHNVISGIYESGSHRIVPVDSCYIENEKADAIIVTVRELLSSFKIKPYNEDTGYGLLRHVLIRTGAATGQIMVVLVLASPILPSKNHFVKALCEKHPEITTIVVNVNGRGTSMVLGEREQVVYGKGYIEDELCGKRFRISSKSFYQVNPVQTRKLYERALEYAGLTGKETVLDAYCGTGTIGILAADRAGEVLGVELNGDAVRDARTNAKRNGTENIRFYQNDAGRFLKSMAEDGRDGRDGEAGTKSVDVLFMDPPRAGSGEAFLAAVAEIKPRKVVYISCNPDTLVRDLSYLADRGMYRVRRAGAVDMFPFTDSIEAVCLLERTERSGK